MQKKYLEKGTLRHFRAIFEEYAAYLSRKRQHRNTLCCKTRVVRYFLGFLESHKSKTRNLRKLRVETVHAFLFTLRDFETSTYNNYLIHLRQFLTWLERHHQVAPMSWLLHGKPAEDSLPRNIPLFQMEQICTPAEQEADLPPSRLALRNQAIVEVLFSTGVRNSELRNMRVGHLSADLTECTIATLKGGVNRTVYLGEAAVDALQRYFQSESVERQKDANRYVFPNCYGKQMSAKSLLTIVKAIGIRRCGCPVTPHMFRHTFATEMLRGCHCIRSVQEMLGHKSINTTTRYCHLDFDGQMKAVNAYHPHAIKAETDDTGEEPDNKS